MNIFTNNNCPVDLDLSSVTFSGVHPVAGQPEVGNIPKCRDREVLRPLLAGRADDPTLRGGQWSKAGHCH